MPLFPPNTKVIHRWAIELISSSSNTEATTFRLETEFVWDGREALRIERHEPQWMECFEELLQYKNEHGNALVPQRYKTNPSLAM